MRIDPVLSTAASVRITVFERGDHGSMPQNTIDLVVLISMSVVRLQTMVMAALAWLSS